MNESQQQDSVKVIEVITGYRNEINQLKQALISISAELCSFIGITGSSSGTFLSHQNASQLLTNIANALDKLDHD